METALVSLGFIAFFVWREREVIRERRHLLDRIQAPKETVAQSLVNELPESPPHVPFDDDEEYQKAISG